MQKQCVETCVSIHPEVRTWAETTWATSFRGHRSSICFHLSYSGFFTPHCCAFQPHEGLPGGNDVSPQHLDWFPNMCRIRILYDNIRPVVLRQIMAIKHSTVLAESPKPRGAQVWRGYQRGTEQKLKTDPAVEDQEQYVLRWGCGEGWVVSHDNNPYRACTRIAALWAVRGRSWPLIYTWKCADGYYQCVSKCQELPGTTRKLLAWVLWELITLMQRSWFLPEEPLKHQLLQSSSQSPDLKPTGPGDSCDCRAYFSRSV